MRRILPFLLLLLFLPVFALAEDAALLTAPDAGMIPPITLHEGPSAYTEPTGYCFAGAQAEVLDQGSGFLQIRIGQMTGWVAEKYLLQSSDWADDTKMLPSCTVITPGTERYQYLYDAPDGQPLAALENHFTVSVLAVTADNDWLLILLPDNTTGYLPVEAVLFADSTSHAYVTSSEPSLRLHLREEPTTKSDSLGSYYCGTKVALLFSVNAPDSWTRVSVCGQKGWMKTEFLSFAEDIGSWLPPLGLVQGTDESGLNLRNAPDYDASVITRYAPGTTVEMMAVYGIWAHVRTQDGHAGYMLLRHLGGDQPAAVANSIALNDTAVRLLDSRPSKAWQHTADGSIFAPPETCAVSSIATGAVSAVPVASLPIWDVSSSANNQPAI